MYSITKFRLGAVAAVVALFPLTLATPLSPEPSGLKPRRVDPITNCDDTQKAKLIQDFKEVADLADFAGGIDPNHVVCVRVRPIKLQDIYTNLYPCSFDHYFRIDDLDGVQRMWNALKKVNDPDYTFSVTCAAQDDKDCEDR